MLKTTLCAAFAVLAWGCGGSSGHSRGAHEVHSEASGCGCERGEACNCRQEGRTCNCRHGGHHGEHGEHHGEHGEEHGHAPGPVADFHAVLAPLWHAEHGAARTDATCAAVADLQAKAAAIQAGPAPEGADEAAYRQAATGLQGAVEALGTACAEANRPSFDARFEAVHTAFHGVGERAGAGQGHH